MTTYGKKFILLKLSDVSRKISLVPFKLILINKKNVNISAKLIFGKPRLTSVI